MAQRFRQTIEQGNRRIFCRWQQIRTFTFVDQGLQGAGRSRPHLWNAIITIFTVAETATSTTYNKFILAYFGISVISALIFSRPRTDTVDFRTTPFPELLPIRILV
jgi:hypothetical protein